MTRRRSQQRSRYIAFVGSRKKAEALKAALAQRGVNAEWLAKLKAPAGLDLGAITPEEIAISVLAEIVAVRRGKLRGDPEGSGATSRPRNDNR